MNKIFARLILVFWVLVIIGVMIYITKEPLLILGLTLLVITIVSSLVWALDQL